MYKNGFFMRKIIFFIAFLLPFSASAKLLNLDYFELDNGLQVAVVENHKAPVALQMLYYKTGSINDPKGKGGIAHLLEHLMFRGTKKIPDQMFNRLTDEYGARNNAYTIFDVTAYYEFSDISKLELMMALEADRMQNLNISDEVFAKEREVVLEERRQRFETKPAPLFYETLYKLLWQDAPMANPVSGNVVDIKALTKADAELFYKQWYRPDNALLVLAGDITLKEAKTLVQKYYGTIKNQGSMPQMQKYEMPKAADMLFNMKLAAVEQPRFAQYIRIEPESLTVTDSLALELLAQYLAGDDTAYLYDQLVYKDKKFLAIDVGSSYNKNYGGVFAFYVSPPDDTLKIEQIAELIDINIKEGLKALTEEKLLKIKNQMLSDTVYLQENPQTAAKFVGEMLLAEYTPEEIIHFDEAIKSITVEDVLRAWEKVQASVVRLNGYLSGETK